MKSCEPGEPRITPVIQYLEDLQKTPAKCREIGIAIQSLKAALYWLRKRPEGKKKLELQEDRNAR